jgi:flavodoxin
MIIMKPALVVYDTTFGNTKLLAEEIAAGIQDAGEIICVIKHHKKLNGCDIRRFDAFLFGGPIHAAMATRGIKSVIKKAAKAGLDGKIVSTFDTHMGHEGRGVTNMEKLLTKVAPNAYLITPGFSAAVEGFRGPLSKAEIPKAREFGKALGKEILGQPQI